MTIIYTFDMGAARVHLQWSGGSLVFGFGPPPPFGVRSRSITGPSPLSLSHPILLLLILYVGKLSRSLSCKFFPTSRKVEYPPKLVSPARSKNARRKSHT